MDTRTPLWIRPEQVSDLHRIAYDLLDSLREDADTLMMRNDDEWAEWPERGDHLGERLEVESWTEDTTQQLRDVMYLLAVGDRGHTDAADADPERASKQAHYDRRRNALARLREAGLLDW